jgi:hypothetical protein
VNLLAPPVRPLRGLGGVHFYSRCGTSENLDMKGAWALVGLAAGGARFDPIIFRYGGPLSCLYPSFSEDNCIMMMTSHLSPLRRPNQISSICLHASPTSAILGETPEGGREKITKAIA